MTKRLQYTGECDDAQANFAGCTDPRGVLQPGAIYEVEREDVHSWHTKVFLKHVNGGFNSVLFVEQDEPDKTISPLEQRAAAEWSKYAKEPVCVVNIKGALYAYGSELACLRLEHHMRCGRAGYSANLKTWYWCKEAAL